MPRYNKKLREIAIIDTISLVQRSKTKIVVMLRNDSQPQDYLFKIYIHGIADLTMAIKFAIYHSEETYRRWKDNHDYHITAHIATVSKLNCYVDVDIDIAKGMLSNKRRYILKRFVNVT